MDRIKYPLLTQFFSIICFTLMCHNVVKKKKICCYFCFISSTNASELWKIHIHTERWQKHTKRILDHVSHYPCWASESMASWAADEQRLNLQAFSGIWLILMPPGWGDGAASALQRPSSDLIPQRWHSAAP